MDRAHVRTSRLDPFAGSTILSWIIPDKYFEAGIGIKEGLNIVAQVLKTQGFGDAQVHNYDCKTEFTNQGQGRINFSNILYLATILPLHLDLDALLAQKKKNEPQKIWFA